MKKVLIIGGVAGGASCAARLRRLDETAQIILIERGPYISYANCGLPYHVGGTIASRNALLVTPEAVMRNRFRVDVRTNNEAIAIHRNAKTVTICKTVIRQFKSAHHLQKESRVKRLSFLRFFPDLDRLSPWEGDFSALPQLPEIRAETPG